MTPTPGPWFTSPLMEDDLGGEFVTVGPFDVSDKPVPNHYEDTIAEVMGGNHDAVSNARLIAAAPELLAACKAALGAFEFRHAINWSELEAAITKAEGR